MRRDRRCSFFFRPIYFWGDEQAMPMHVFRNVCVVHNLYDDRLALAHSQEGTGDLIAVADSADHNLRGQLDHHRCDSQTEIRSALGSIRFQRRTRSWLQNLLEAYRLRKRGPEL